MRNKMTIFASLVAALTLVAVPGAQVFAADETWGPQDRASFTWDNPADYVTFNSMTDNPTIGSERNFVRVKEAGTEGAHYDNVTVEAGKEYEVYVYYHNNAAANYNESGKGIAQNVLLQTDFPTKLQAGDAGVVKGVISASNANPTSVWDTAYLNANSTVYLSYVPNSAVIHNGGSANGSILDAESLFGNGAKLAYDNNYWGIIPGCNEYAGYVTYRIKADAPGFWTEKTVSATGAENYSDTIVANVGDVLDFKITYENTGTTAQDYVTVYDQLASGLTYVQGSLKVVSPDAPEGVNIDDATYSLADGFVIGNFQPGEKATITYQAMLVDDADVFACGETVIYNAASIATANGTETDKTRITVVRDCSESAVVTELPKTGPTEIALACVILIAISVGATYWIISFNKVRKTTSSAISGSAKESLSESDIVRDGIVDKK